MNDLILNQLAETKRAVKQGLTLTDVFKFLVLNYLLDMGIDLFNYALSIQIG